MEAADEAQAASANGPNGDTLDGRPAGQFDWGHLGAMTAGGLSHTFDFPALPKLNKKLVLELELACCEFIDRRENVLSLGNPEPETFCCTSLGA